MPYWIPFYSYLSTPYLVAKKGRFSEVVELHMYHPYRPCHMFYVWAVANLVTSVSEYIMLYQVALISKVKCRPLAVGSWYDCMLQLLNWSFSLFQPGMSSGVSLLWEQVLSFWCPARVGQGIGRLHLETQTSTRPSAPPSMRILPSSSWSNSSPWRWKQVSWGQLCTCYICTCTCVHNAIIHACLVYCKSRIFGVQECL